MGNKEIDFYNNTNLKSYNLNESMRYQLSILESLDTFTRLHSEHVASITCRLCEYLHLNKNFTVYATMCAYLHDVGKQFIPPSILQKPSSFTDEEYAIMKKHTQRGYDMCMQDVKLRPYAAGALYHHEALDGSGYPQGLTKKDIPIVGQIIRVADEYDAITSKRQYKTHIGISDTLQIIVENTKTKKQEGLEQIAKNAKMGKNNKAVVKALFKVVIDDTEYEISCMFDYVKDLKENIHRLEEIDRYYQKIQKERSEESRNYYLEELKKSFRIR